MKAVELLDKTQELLGFDQEEYRDQEDFQKVTREVYGWHTVKAIIFCRKTDGAITIFFDTYPQNGWHDSPENAVTALYATKRDA
jgi:hypothetical protein